VCVYVCVDFQVLKNNGKFITTALSAREEVTVGSLVSFGLSLFVHKFQEVMMGATEFHLLSIYRKLHNIHRMW